MLSAAVGGDVVVVSLSSQKLTRIRPRDFTAGLYCVYGCARPPMSMPQPTNRTAVTTAAMSNGANEKVYRGSGDSLCAASIANVGPFFVVRDLESRILKGSEALAELCELRRLADAGEQFLPDRTKQLGSALANQGSEELNNMGL